MDYRAQHQCPQKGSLRPPIIVITDGCACTADHQLVSCRSPIVPAIMSGSLLRHRHVDVQSNRICVVETLPSAVVGPTVVLLAGISGTTVTWLAVQRLLASRFRTFAYDRLGLGQSDGTDKERSAGTLA